MISSYEKFSNAIIKNDINIAEEIFANSDVRCELIAYSTRYSSQEDILKSVSLFKSLGLKNNALKICSNCSETNCSVKESILGKSNIISLSSSQNIKINKLRNTRDER